MPKYQGRFRSAWSDDIVENPDGAAVPLMNAETAAATFVQKRVVLAR